MRTGSLPSTLEPHFPASGLALERRDNGFKVGSDNDGNKLVLAGPGGGMGTAPFIGAMEVLIEEGLLHQFEAVATTSATNLWGLAGLAGQIKVAKEVCTEEVPRSRFFDPTMLLAKRKEDRKVLSLDVIKDLITVTHPIDMDAVANHPTELVFEVTDLTNMRIVPFSTHTLDPKDTAKWAVRGAHLALGAGPAEVEDGIAYGDGEFLRPFYVDQAEDIGATHILGIDNTPVDQWHFSALKTAGMAFWVGRRNPNGRKLYYSTVRGKGKRISEVRRNANTVGQTGPQFEFATPEDCGLPKLNCMDPETLRRGIAAGKNMMWKNINSEQRIPLPNRRQRFAENLRRGAFERVSDVVVLAAPTVL